MGEHEEAQERWLPADPSDDHPHPSRPGGSPGPPVPEGLGSVGLGPKFDGGVGRGRQVEVTERIELRPGPLDLMTRRPSLRLDRDRFEVALPGRDAGAVGEERHVELAHPCAPVRAEDAGRFSADLLLLLADERHDVVGDREGGDAGKAGTRERLVCRDVDDLRPGDPHERGQREHEARRGAVRVRDQDAPTRTRMPEESQVGSVHLGDEQGHVGIETVIGSVREDRDPPADELRLDRSGGPRG